MRRTAPGGSAKAATESRLVAEPVCALSRMLNLWTVISTRDEWPAFLGVGVKASSTFRLACGR
jgi:hypothetical protein